MKQTVLDELARRRAASKLQADALKAPKVQLHPKITAAFQKIAQMTGRDFWEVVNTACDYALGRWAQDARMLSLGIALTATPQMPVADEPPDAEAPEDISTDTPEERLQKARELAGITSTPPEQ
jgi:hypothetical protein